MEKNKYATKIINDVSQVPEGYKRLAEVAPRDTREGKIIHKFLSDAHTDGQVRAVKLVRTTAEFRLGCVFIHVADAEEFIRYRQAKAAAPKAVKQEVPVVQEVAASPSVVDCEGLIAAMESLRHAVAALSSNVRDLQAATELRIEKESGQYA